MSHNNTPAFRASEAASFRVRWTLGRKLGLLVAGLLGLLVLSSVDSLVRMDNIADEIHGISTVDVPLLGLVISLETRQLQQHVALEMALRAGTGEDRDDVLWKKGRNLFQAQSRHMEAEFAAAADLVKTAAEGPNRARYEPVKREIASLLVEHREFETHAIELFDDLDSEKPVLDVARRMEQLEEEAAELEPHIKKLEVELRALAQQSAATAEEHERSAFQITLAFAIAGLLAGSVLAFWILRRITSTVKEVTQRVESLSRGDLTADLLNVTTSDELGQMSCMFNTMVQNLGRQVRETRGAVESLTAGATEILAAAKQQAASTKEQAATIQEITASLEEIGQSGSQISARASEVASRAAESSSGSEEGREAMRATNQDMESIREQIEDVAENIVALSEKTQAVGEIIAAVNEIAEQSNLLALNAAIEAAAAGEHGARFSVVANEIKNLADQAKDSTGQVGRILGEIQKGINSAVMLTEEAVKRADEGKRKATTTEGSIEALLAATQESVQTFQQIVAGSGQQQIGITQVTQGMQDIRQAAEQSAVGTSQLERAVSDLTALGRQLETTVAEYVV